MREDQNKAGPGDDRQGFERSRQAPGDQKAGPSKDTEQAVSMSEIETLRAEVERWHQRCVRTEEALQAADRKIGELSMLLAEYCDRTQDPEKSYD
jgi:hypothetical protein